MLQSCAGRHRLDGVPDPAIMGFRPSGLRQQALSGWVSDHCSKTWVQCDTHGVPVEYEDISPEVSDQWERGGYGSERASEG